MVSENFSLIEINKDEIYRFDISDKEYFLIENKINTLDNGLSLKILLQIIMTKMKIIYIEIHIPIGLMQLFQ